ncbi:reticulon-4-interacting 1 like mitochondrial [Fusarium longipes]|uniref:Reticulon-4-interacting 1 like mitochondrial n=1 Tax=Fusarium longipes TaxID=694270 RepID=A0A395SXH2_9HYPO|nr:reticulon-4-interacting 1 like mitochondrial [Fusarium longipes]
MKAIQILGDTSSPNITVTYSMPKPTPVDSEILVRVHAAGITGDETTWPEVYQTPSRIPGHDISGTIVSFGPSYIGNLKVGQDVFALIAADRGEGQAEYVVCTAEEVAPKPASLSHPEAAVLPIPTLTAWEAAQDLLEIKPEMTVLVTGASGSVGRQFVQLAKHLAGAHVIALASPRNHSVLHDLGAEEVIDYTTSNWENTIGPVDFVFDTVGGEILSKTWETVKGCGTIITVGDPAPAWAYGDGKASESSEYPGVTYKHFIVSPNAKRLADIANMLDEGILKPLGVRKFPFDQGVDAWDCARQRGRDYKVVIEF